MLKPTIPANPQKARKGLIRVWHAFGYSLAGLPRWLGRNWVEVVLLAGTVILVMIVELINTGIETAIDRIGPEWHDLSKHAKDIGSAAVLLSLVLCAGTWCMAIYQRLTT